MGKRATQRAQRDERKAALALVADIEIEQGEMIARIWELEMRRREVLRGL